MQQQELGVVGRDEAVDEEGRRRVVLIDFELVHLLQVHVGRGPLDRVDGVERRVQNKLEEVAVLLLGTTLQEIVNFELVDGEVVRPSHDHKHLYNHLF